MARLVARLVNSGIKVLVTTHSDYFVREINNLITASQIANDKETLKRHNIIDIDILDAKKVGAYVTGAKGGVEKIQINSGGIDTSIFDTIIERENLKAQEIFYTSEGRK